MERIRSYLMDLKVSSKLSWSQIAAKAELPESTVRKVVTGETPDPRFSTIAQVIAAMGGDLAGLNVSTPVVVQEESTPMAAEILPETSAGKSPIVEKPEEANRDREQKYIQQIKDHYEDRIEEIKAIGENRLIDAERKLEQVRSAYNEHITTLKSDKKIWQIATALAWTLFLILLVADLIVGSHGWIRY